MRGIGVSTYHFDLFVERDDEVLWVSFKVSNACKMDRVVFKDLISCNVGVSAVSRNQKRVIRKHILLETVSAVCRPVNYISIIEVGSVPNCKV